MRMETKRTKVPGTTPGPLRSLTRLAAEDEALQPRAALNRGREASRGRGPLAHHTHGRVKRRRE